MTDIVVTVPMNFTHPDAPGKRGLAAWLAEGDPPGSEWSGTEWIFSTWGSVPDVQPGDRCYVACEGRIVGYAPIIRVMVDRNHEKPGKRYHGPIAIVRGGGAVAVTIPQKVTGFRGYRYRWWDRCIEVAID